MAKQKTFYQELKDDKDYQHQLDKFATELIENFEFITNNVKWNLRYYQEKALFIHQYFINLNKENYFKEKIIHKVGNKEITFYGFEMATGSGKTLLMAADILYLLKKGYKDFLIITPDTIIYEKTIKNFSLDDKRCVLSEDTGLKINVITGDTYKDKTCNYDEDADFNIYIFNIQKFFEKNTSTQSKQDEFKGVPYIHRPLEESFWKDSAGNTIPFIEFLRERKLIIITDEAHHYQAKESSEVIKELLPDSVIEYTATAIESNSSYKEQKIIYKYSIKELIRDKYAKKIRALGYESLEERNTNQVSDADKKKILLGMLGHLVKKESLKGKRLKPIMLVRAREIEHSINLLEYIQNEICEDDVLLEEVLQITKNEKAPITQLFWEYYRGIKFNKEKLKTELKKICQNSFRIDSQNKNDVEIIDQWDTIEDNKIEIVIYVKMLDEGIDLNNIYIIAILSDSEFIKTNVKQAIGRGVRLFKEQREFDDSNDLLKRQSENLYIVCDKNRNFNQFIESIRNELELSKDEFGKDDVIIKEVEDKPNLEKIKNSEMSIMVVNQSEKNDSPDILSIIKKTDLVIKKFIEGITEDKNGKSFIKKELSTIIDERDVVSPEYQQTLSDHIIEELKLTLNDYQKELLVNTFIENYPILPDQIKVRESIKELIDKILSKNIYYYSKMGYDNKIIVNIFQRNFIQFFGYFLENYKFDKVYKIDKKKLKDIFQTRKVELEENSYHNWEDHKTPDTLLQIEENEIYFTGYKYSIYNYNKFDSRQERKIANILDNIMIKKGNNNNFWIKNGRRIEYTIKVKGRGQHEYNPDFIVFFEDQFYIIEVKGEGMYAEEFERRGNKEKLVKLGEETKDIMPILLYSGRVNRMDAKTDKFKVLLENNDLHNPNMSLDAFNN